jgi:hypothetical protein
MSKAARAIVGGMGLVLALGMAACSADAEARPQASTEAEELTTATSSPQATAAGPTSSSTTTVVNGASNPVITRALSASSDSVASAQSGTWNVGITGTPTVSATVTSMPTVDANILGNPAVVVSNVPTVNLNGTPAVTATITNTPSVTLSGTPTVNIVGTPSVALSGTPAVAIGSKSAQVLYQQQTAPPFGGAATINNIDISGYSAVRVFVQANQASTGGSMIDIYTYDDSHTSFWRLGSGTINNTALSFASALEVPGRNLTISMINNESFNVTYSVMVIGRP